MSHSVKKTHFSAGSLKGMCHAGGHSPKISSHVSSAHHGCSNRVHHGGACAALGAHGGSGYKGISQHSSLGHGFCFGSAHGGYGCDLSSFGGHGGWKKDGLFGVNGKETMKQLNDRLASYLEKVRSLEHENTELEKKIKQLYDINTPNTFPDFSNYFRTVEELQHKIAAATVDNARIVLQTDNARLAADDFQNKYNMELSLRNNVEADVNGLRRVLDGLTLEKCDLELHLENLHEELLHLKKKHEEEVNCLRAQLGARVTVEVDAAPAVDLNKVLSEIRDEYENLMAKNIREVENRFIKQSEELNCQGVSGPEQIQSVKTEIIELRHTIQTLEIELQAQLSTKSALERTLAETQDTYGSQLSQLQGLIDNVEAQLAQIRSDLERQNHEYKILMDVKTRLEMEIATYRRLLEGEDTHIPKSQSSKGKGSPGGLRIVSITEEFENGKVVSTREQIHQLKC
ncbi:keratin, type I cytoskeletal 42-like [Ascaphus truei]|uniref:keratin, type I cytoskeletal 42-like n=1 Tax=Ascaphus truei TaxID=8439 RepID=UPI003F593854